MVLVYIPKETLVGTLNVSCAHEPGGHVAFEDIFARRLRTERDVTTARLLDVSSRNEGAFLDVYVLAVFNGDGFSADYVENHFDSTFSGPFCISSRFLNVFTIPLDCVTDLRVTPVSLT